MMKNQYVSLLLCAAMLTAPLSIVGCGKKDEPVKIKPTNVYKSEILMEQVVDYTKEDTGTRVDFQNLYGSGDQVIVEATTYDEGWTPIPLFYSINTETGEKTDLTFSLPDFNPENSYRSNFSIGGDGSVWYTINSSIYNEETGMYTEDMTLHHIDASGSTIAEMSLYDLFTVKEGEYLQMQSFQIVGNQCYISIEEKGLCVLSDDMNAYQVLDVGVANVSKILEQKDGLLLVGYSETDWKPQIISYNPETKQASEPYKLSSKAQNHIYNAMPSDTYDFVYSDAIAVYGYDLASDTSTELLNWVNSDINATNLQGTYVAPNGTIYTILNDYGENTNTTQVMRLTRIPDEEVVEKYILTYATLYMDYNLHKEVIKFNKESEEYRITIRDYSEYNSEENQYTGAQAQLNNDIVSGNIPDIIQVTRDMPYQSYAAKGLFADLMPFIEADASMANDIYPNLLEAYKISGKLCALPISFAIQTQVGKSSVVGENDGWTMAEMNAALKKFGLTDPFNGDVTRDSYLEGFCAIVRDQFIDKDTGACSFDSPEFIEILEFIKTLPEKTVYDTVNWDEVDQTFWTDREMAYRNNTAMLSQQWVNGYQNFWELQEGTFGEKVSFVGYPNEARLGSSFVSDFEFAVAEQSLCKEGAWAFISTLIRNYASRNPENQWQFSVLKSANKKLADYALSYHDDMRGGGMRPGGGIVNDAEPETPDSGKKTWTVWIGEQEIDIGMMSAEAVAHVDSLVGSTQQVYRYDKAMMDIIKEEASAFFAGQKSAQEVAKLIQSRVSIYVNESR